MRLSELVRSDCHDRSDRRIGRVYDLRVAHGPQGFRVLGIVVGRDGVRARIAHSWGYAEGRASAPWLLGKLAAPGTREARFVPAERVLEWGPGSVSIDADWDELEPLREVIGDE